MVNPQALSRLPGMLFRTMNHTHRTTDPAPALRHPPKHRRVGMSLIEVTMILIVISGVALIGMTQLDGQWYARRNVRGDAEQLRQALRTIRNTAIEQQADVRVTIDTRNDQWQIDQAAGPMGPAKQWTIALQSTASLRPTRNNVTFYPTGSADRDVQLRLSDGTVTDEVRITAVSGTIQ
ncbi:hypothetical protein Mal65_09070 [Crateriforma conspicua]|nr:hypothetical protein Mal65_09070 [Crateriforma conspicua]